MGVCGVQENDLFQNAIMRMVANDCIAMKRFSGKDEGELMAYLAVICRSSVLDTMRRTTAVKRTLDRDGQCGVDPSMLGNSNRGDFRDFDRKVLLREIESLTSDAIESSSGPASSRDRLVFSLHFYHGLSFNQISQCKGINLSKAGVEKLLKRLISRVQTLATTGKLNETAL
jgi:RNA polymerase sigma factor (sigma-70 family)